MQAIFISALAVVSHNGDAPVDNLQNPAAVFECRAGTFHVSPMLLGREGSGHHDQLKVWFCRCMPVGA